ncbi:MAG TPA: hypothetical protein VFH78_10560 [Candidatus Thermoplasmatota archaeon]|nr:hypothetical protein [Candidatus Thermoplasmatota archaeon]
MRLALAPVVGLLLLASLATFPSASAQPAAPDCEPEDVSFWYNAARADGSSEEVDGAAELRQGDHVWFQANGPLACDGAMLTLLVSAYDGAEYWLVAWEEAWGYPPRAHADFVYWEMTADIPDCAFRVELWLGDPWEGEMLDAAEGGEGACDFSMPGECVAADVTALSYTITRADGTSFETDALFEAELHAEDRISATLEVGEDCAGVVVALSSYLAHDDLSYTLFHEATAVVPEGGGRVEVGPTVAPDCTFVVILWLGQGPPLAFIDGAMGGEGECGETSFQCSVVTASAGAEGAIALSWSEVAGADGYAIVRTDASGEEVFLAFLEADATSYTDDSTIVGQTYTYSVVPFLNGVPARFCESVEVTAVPFFGAPLLGALALVGVVGAYAAFRRSG